MPVPIGVTLQHTYAATPERVFRAWTSPAEFPRWWHPAPEYSCHNAEIDLRVGGSYKITMDCPKGLRSVTGKYLEVDPPRRLAFTWGHEGHDASKETVVTITLEPTATGGCLLTLRHERFPDNNMVCEHARGWTTLLAALEAAL